MSKKFKIELSGSDTPIEIYRVLTQLATMLDIVDNEVEKIKWNDPTFTLKITPEDE